MRLKVYSLAAVACVQALPSSAQTCSQSGELWRGVYLGMSKAQFRELYPTGRADILPGCPAYISGKFGKDGLSKMLLVHAKPTEGCPDQIAADFSAQMGPANSDVRYQPTIYFGMLPIMQHKTIVQIWTNQCRLVALHRAAKTNKSYTVIFQAKSDASKPMGW